MSDCAKVCTGIPAPPLPRNCRQSFIVSQPERGIAGGKLSRACVEHVARDPQHASSRYHAGHWRRRRAQPPPSARLDDSRNCELPLPHLGLGDRLLLRALALLAARQVVAIDGLQHIRPAQDPIILAANHSTRRELLLVPALLLLHRGGSIVHFLADWNFRLIPGVALLYARARVVTVTRKPAKPRFLNVLKPLYAQPRSTLERASAHLVAGRAVGIFSRRRGQQRSETAAARSSWRRAAISRDRRSRRARGHSFPW
jgi:hypothetical protein